MITASTDPLTLRLERIRRLALVVLFADLTAVGARISLPLAPVPLTLQTAVVLLSGALLGPGAGALSQVLYLAMGLAGLPVFSSGGGLGYLLSPTIGYLAGFVGGSWLTGFLFRSRAVRGWPAAFAAMAAGLLPIYAAGLAGLHLNLMLVQNTRLAPGALLKAGLLIPLPGDLLKAALATAVWISLRSRRVPPLRAPS